MTEKQKIEMAKRIEMRATADLIPYAKNARTHSDQQVQAIAASITEFGFTNPVLIDSAEGIIAGHGRVMAAKELGLQDVPVVVLDHLSEQQRRAYILADNKLADLSGWDEGFLAEEIADLAADGYELSLTGFSDEELSDVLGVDMVDVAGYSRAAAGAGGGSEGGARPEREPQPSYEGLTDPDEAPEPEPQIEPVTKTGDVWLLGDHRVMCGDSTDADDIARLMNGARASLLHADPPYGMGKQKDGVAKDNLYKEKLDDFQMQWWQAFRPSLEDNASAYIWGNAPDLWRLWWRRIEGTEKIEFENHITWDKKSIAGMKSDLMIAYPVASEHCLFFKLGEQFVWSINADDFPEQWQPLLDYMMGEAEAVGLTPSDVKRVCGVAMYSHWFSKSQFRLAPEKHYAALSAEYPDAFNRPHAELKREWDKTKGAARDVIKGKLEGMRGYFDNAHDIMTDVWEFPRVVGEERHGHATPKPVAMMERVMKSSLPVGGLCVEPFGGSGSTLMGAQNTGRRCYTMELQTVYCDVMVKRWQAYTGEAATLEGDGRSFDEVKAERVPLVDAVF